MIELEFTKDNLPEAIEYIDAAIQRALGSKPWKYDGSFQEFMEKTVRDFFHIENDYEITLDESDSSRIWINIFPKEVRDDNTQTS